MALLVKFLLISWLPRFWRLSLWRRLLALAGRFLSCNRCSLSQGLGTRCSLLFLSPSSRVSHAFSVVQALASRVTIFLLVSSVVRVLRFLDSFPQQSCPSVPSPLIVLPLLGFALSSRYKLSGHTPSHVLPVIRILRFSILFPSTRIRRCLLVKKSSIFWEWRAVDPRSGNVWGLLAWTGNQLCS